MLMYFPQNKYLNMKSLGHWQQRADTERSDTLSHLGVTIDAKTVKLSVLLVGGGKSIRSINLHITNP